ncbi:TspO/MBR family protein [Natronomonas marina]|jgi:benzodiazapine receptor|uniref:TspO/MBR family protein n=1 Tax=Natronomonas marina TaxID=2961939 RepID=UPI0020C9DF1D|nr:TspO/MBR family protein [Natronomonas marina]
MVTLPSREAALRAVGFVLLVNVVGAAPALLAGPDSAWFQALEKPALYPPPVVFGIVWTALFTLMGVALWLVWGSDAEGRQVAIALFAAQMAFNVAWTPVFFAREALLVALGVIGALWVLVAVTIVAFDRVDRRAAALLVPYLLWVSFAFFLNYRFWQLN